MWTPSLLRNESVAIDCQFIDVLYNKYVWFWLIASLEAIFISWSDYIRTKFQWAVLLIVWRRVQYPQRVFQIFVLLFKCVDEIPKETRWSLSAHSTFFEESKTVKHSFFLHVNATMIDWITWLLNWKWCVFFFIKISIFNIKNVKQSIESGKAILIMIRIFWLNKMSPIVMQSVPRWKKTPLDFDVCLSGEVMCDLRHNKYSSISIVGNWQIFFQAYSTDSVFFTLTLNEKNKLNEHSTSNIVQIIRLQ